MKRYQNSLAKFWTSHIIDNTLMTVECRAHNSELLVADQNLVLGEHSTVLQVRGEVDRCGKGTGLLQWVVVVVGWMVHRRGKSAALHTHSFWPGTRSGRRAIVLHEWNCSIQSTTYHKLLRGAKQSCKNLQTHYVCHKLNCLFHVRDRKLVIRRVLRVFLPTIIIGQVCQKSCREPFRTRTG